MADEGAAAAGEAAQLALKVGEVGEAAQLALKAGEVGEAAQPALKPGEAGEAAQLALKPGEAGQTSQHPEEEAAQRTEEAVEAGVAGRGTRARQ
jgi:hypothetical protein